MSVENLEVFVDDLEDFTVQFITMDESWVHHCSHHYQPE